jgi:hypothetical protein
MWLDFCRDFKPDAVDIIGDMIDCYSLSRFDKNPERKKLLADEVSEGVGLLAEIRKAAPKAEIHYSEGNHEERLTRTLWSKAPGLAGLRGLTVPALLELDRFKIQWHPAGSRGYRHGPLWFTHGNVIRKHAGSSGRAMSDKINGSVIMGHSHRMGFCPHTVWDTEHAAWEAGHLCDVDEAEYAKGPNWQAGWLTVEFPTPGLFDVSMARCVCDKRGTYQVLYKGEIL